MFTDKIYDKWMVGTQKEKLEKILAKIGTENIKGKKILDIGSGPGFLGEVMREMNLGCSVISSDIDKENICKAVGLKVLASGNYLPFREKRFDFVFCIDTIHLLDRKVIKKEFTNLLKDNGILIVSNFCNEYNSEERIKELEGNFGGLAIKRRFFVRTKSEWDAVIVAMLK